MRKIKRTIGGLYRHWKTPRAVARPTPAPCVNCGAGAAIFLGTKVRPDFDVRRLPPGLTAAFLERKDGVCVNCGFYQSYNRFTREQLIYINGMGKDVTTSNDAFHVYPVPASFVQQFEAENFGKRLSRWKIYLEAKGVRPASALFLRVQFGAGPEFLANTYGAAVSGLDMSDVCLRTTRERVPSFRPLKGSINGMLEGEFLESGPYDALFSFHVLTHACDPHTVLRQMRSLLRPGGFAVFTDEVTRKPNNPFHMVHLSEFQLRSLLLEHFDRVERIDDCGRLNAPNITPYTLKGDEPDLVAWADK